MDNSPLPWRIDQDNADGIAIVADNGDLVHFVSYEGIPEERGAAFREQIIKAERANAYFILNCCNKSS